MTPADPTPRAGEPLTRDNIAALKMAAVYPNGRPAPNGYEGGWNDALDEVLARLDATPAALDECPVCGGLTFHKYGCTFGLAALGEVIPPPEPIKNETESGYARRIELWRAARLAGEPKP